MTWFDFLKRTERDIPQSVAEYLALDFRIDRKRSLDEQTFCVLDCETTGLNKSAQLVTVGAIHTTRQAIYIGEALDQRYPVENMEMAEIHGELAAVQIQEGSQKERIAKLLRFIASHIIVGHHISFDIQKIEKMIGHSFSGFRLKNKVVDTFELLRRLDPVAMDRNVAGHDHFHLDSLCDQYSIPVENRHTALGDAYMTAQLLQKLLTRLKARGISRSAEL